MPEETIDAVSRYLDFCRDEASHEDTANKLNSNIHPLLPGDIYPAVEALTCLGSAANSTMARVIESEEPESLSSQNAMWVVLLDLSSNFQDAVDYFNQAAEKSTSEEGKKKTSQGGR